MMLPRRLLCALAAAVILMVGVAAVAYAHKLTDPNGAWFQKQTNMVGGSCCKLGDSHELDPGDVRYDEETGLYSVRLPDPSDGTFGLSLNEPTNKPKQWVEIPALKMRDPNGGMPPVSNPIIWYDSFGTTYSIYCFEPTTMY